MGLINPVAQEHDLRFVFSPSFGFAILSMFSQVKVPHCPQMAAVVPDITCRHRNL